MPKYYAPIKKLINEMYFMNTHSEWKIAKRHCAGKIYPWNSSIIKPATDEQAARKKTIWFSIQEPFFPIGKKPTHNHSLTHQPNTNTLKQTQTFR